MPPPLQVSSADGFSHPADIIGLFLKNFFCVVYHGVKSWFDCGMRKTTYKTAAARSHAARLSHIQRKTAARELAAREFDASASPHPKSDKHGGGNGLRVAGARFVGGGQYSQRERSDVAPRVLRKVERRLAYEDMLAAIGYTDR